MGIENFIDMNDVTLKPKLLHMLLKEEVPDEKKPFDSPWKLLEVTSMLETHTLLSELVSDSTDAKLIERWKSAVDDWVNRLLSLASLRSSLYKSFAGISLLAVTCKECSADRFLSSYAIWFEKLYSHIQSPVDSQFVKVASCTSMSALITRLSGFPNAKKDGNLLAGKLIHPVLKLLKEESSEDVWEGAVDLLYALLTSFPSSIQRHYGSVEAAVTSRILSGRCSANMQEKLAETLAWLPRSRGDEDSWLSVMRKIILLVNGCLSELFHGLEDETKWDEAIRLLIPPGETPPSSVWGQTLLEETSNKARKRAKIASISTLIICCRTMLTSSYPVPISVPVRSLLALVERVLMVNGSLPQESLPFVTVADQEFICSELPVLHSCILELLASIIMGVHSLLLPHVAYVVRLVKMYFRRSKLLALREKVYAVTKLLLTSTGIGVAIYLAQVIVDNAVLDLRQVGSQAPCANTKICSEALLQLHHKKRKRGATASTEHQNDVTFQVELSKMRPATSISVQIAALEALEALLTVGGGLRSDSWKSEVDNILITVATEYCTRGWVTKEKNTVGSTSKCMDLQLASLRALLASLLCSSHVLPQNISRGLDIFRAGRQEIGTKVSEFCCLALLSLEVLVHPRALHLFNFSSASSFDEDNHRFQENAFSGTQKLNTVFLGGMQKGRHDPQIMDDDLCERWLSGPKEVDTHVCNCDEGKSTEKPALDQNIQPEETSLVSVSLDANNARRSSTDRQTETNAVATIPAVNADNTEAVTEKTPETAALDLTDNEMASADPNVPGEGTKTAVSEDTTYRTTLLSKNDSTISVEPDDDESMDTIPDIVDVEPDSD